MAFTKKNEEAVSPVIGVILMVAITVILAAVIAAFVFGMAGNIQKSHVVSITAQRITGGVQFTNNGGQDVGSLSSLNITLTGNSTNLNGLLGKTVGSQYTVNTSTTSGASALVIGTFADGSQQILLQTTV
ncbi:type IV pilin [Methanoregula sp.]|uniref:type IV pilin n=1 Tax=Methanoregula sp. TaxID=2052170 RepID=UPI003564E945